MHMQAKTKRVMREVLRTLEPPPEILESSAALNMGLGTILGTDNGFQNLAGAEILNEADAIGRELADHLTAAFEDGVFDYQQFENILADYRSQHEFLDMEMNQENKEDIQKLLNSFALLSETAIPEFGQSYIELLFNNLVRYVGEDFIALPPEVCTVFATDHCVSQTVNGKYVINTYLNMDSSTAINFAERYTNEAYAVFDEYVAASIEDFINLHNGLYIVNASNSHSSELTLGTIEQKDHSLLSFETVTYSFPLYYSFGIVHLLLEIVSI